MKKYDSTVARIAGNLLSGSVGPATVPFTPELQTVLVHDAVRMARAIVEETKRTEPEPTEATP